MSTHFLKKQAKRLSSLLPEHLKTHAENPAALSACQDLVSKVNGFASFHAAMAHPSVTGQPPSDELESSPSVAADAVAPTVNIAESENPFLNPEQAIRGYVSYGSTEEPNYKGRYWLVDMGVDSDRGGLPMTAMVFDPLDDVCNGQFDVNALLNRDEIRTGAADQAMQDVVRLAMTRSPPDLYLKTIAKGTPTLFVLVVHQRKREIVY